jgi:hypothetical protein
MQSCFFGCAKHVTIVVSKHINLKTPKKWEKFEFVDVQDSKKF